MFDTSLLAKVAPLPGPTTDQLRKHSKRSLRERDEKLAVLLADRTPRRGVEAPARPGRRGKKTTTGKPDTHDYSETETRDTS